MSMWNWLLRRARRQGAVFGIVRLQATEQGVQAVRVAPPMPARPGRQALPDVAVKPLPRKPWAFKPGDGDTVQHLETHRARREAQRALQEHQEPEPAPFNWQGYDALQAASEVAREAERRSRDYWNEYYEDDGA